MIDIYGRILNNEHVDRFIMSDDDKLKSVHTQSDLVRALNLESAEFDSDANSKDFSAKELAESIKASKEVITVFDGDKIRQLKKDMEEIDKKLNPKKD